MRRVRVVLRSLLIWFLLLIPFHWLVPLRNHYACAEPGSFARFLLRIILSLVRLRPIPKGTTFELQDESRLRFVQADSVVISYIFWFGESGWEHSEADWWRYFCRQATSILECGANVGYYTVAGASVARDTPYVSVEPHPVTANALRRNVQLNRLSNVEIVEAAVVSDDSFEQVDLTMPKEDRYQAPAGAMVRSASEWTLDRSRGSIRVDAIDARTIVRDADLIKLDVEGAEFGILSSSFEHIVVNKPVIILEVYPGSRKLWQLIRRLCREYEYSALAIMPEGLKRFDPLALEVADVDAEFSTHDIVICPVPVAERIEGLQQPPVEPSYVRDADELDLIRG